MLRYLIYSTIYEVDLSRYDTSSLSSYYTNRGLSISVIPSPLCTGDNAY